MNNERDMAGRPLPGSERRPRRPQAEAELRRRPPTEARQYPQARGPRDQDGRPSPVPGGGAPGSRGVRREGSPPREQQPRIRNRWFRALVMVAGTLVGCVFLAIFLLQSVSDLFGINQPDRDVEVVIPQGAGISDISKILGEEGILEHPLTFRLYLGFKGLKDEDMQPGEYVFNTEMAYDELIIALQSGRSIMDVVRVTFIEGMTLLDVAKSLEENKVCSADEFIRYLDSAEYNFEFFGAIEDNPLRYHRLEGYLFPDTYDFYQPENVESVARKFIRNTNEKLTPELLARMQELNMTIDQTLTLASIIQKEAGQSDDMKLVSSVFHNRMDSGQQYPHLQSDVTILYVETDIKPRLSLANQPMYDAYNTYVCEGLPVGPICNPGLDAIEAVLYPEDTPFYFFVTDINMDFYYAETPQKHYQNVNEAARIGDVHGVDTR